MSRVVNSKIAIIGAGGVGTSIAYAALIRESARQIALYDINESKVKAEVLDLAHGSQFTGRSSIAGGSDLSVVDGSHLIVITAGAKQEPGQTRTDLAATNVSILESLVPKLLERAPDALLMLVTNPCDVLTVAAQRLSGLPAERIFSSGTVLDTARLRWMLAQQLGVAQRSVHAHIVGEHGDTEFALWSSATIGITPLLDWEDEQRKKFTVPELEGIVDDVRNAAYRVIEGKGATNYAIGLSSARIIEALLGDERTILPISTVLTGFRGIDGVALSVPSIVSADGVFPVVTTPFSAAEQRQLEASAEHLRGVQRSLGI